MPCIAIGNVTLAAITGIIVQAAYLRLSHCNLFEDRVPADFIYRYPIFKWVAEFLLHGRVLDYHPYQYPARWHVYKILQKLNDNSY